MTDDQRPNFSGFWRLNLERSVLRGHAPKEILMWIEHGDETIVQTVLVTPAGGGEQRQAFSFYTNGRETALTMSGGTGRTRARWYGSVLVIESSLKIADRDLAFRDHWSLSPDGTILRMAHPDDDLAGQISVLEKASPDAAARFTTA